MDLKGKVAIVTGASSGIGTATVKSLLKIGMTVLGFARRKEKVESLGEGFKGKLIALRIDVTKSQELINGFAWATKNVGPLHVLINSAGVVAQSSIVTGDFTAWKKTMDTNFMSTAVSCKEAIGIMREHKIDGYIINISSVLGYYDIWNPQIVMYRTSKSALITMTENVRVELARMKSKIRITTLGPGLVKTQLLETAGYGKERIDSIYSVPHLDTEDVANTIVYLLSTPQHIHISEILVRATGEDFTATPKT